MKDLELIFPSCSVNIRRLRGHILPYLGSPLRLQSWTALRLILQYPSFDLITMKLFCSVPYPKENNVFNVFLVAFSLKK